MKMTKAQEKVKKVMHEFKEKKLNIGFFTSISSGTLIIGGSTLTVISGVSSFGTFTIGKSNKTVKDRKQAIAIALSEAKKRKS